jgi:hypothetical protein
MTKDEEYAGADESYADELHDMRLAMEAEPMFHVKHDWEVSVEWSCPCGEHRRTIIAGRAETT